MTGRQPLKFCSERRSDILRKTARFMIMNHQNDVRTPVLEMTQSQYLSNNSEYEWCSTKRHSDTYDFFLRDILLSSGVCKCNINSASLVDMLKFSLDANLLRINNNLLKCELTFKLL